MTELRLGVVTGESAPDLTDDGRALADALRDRGFAVEPVVWSRAEPTGLDAALLRSCWDYHRQPAAFRDWLDALHDAGVTLVNPHRVVTWNLHKSYLRDLAETGVPVIETEWVGRGDDADLAAVLRRRGWDDAVVKPAVGAKAKRIFRTSPADAAADQAAFDALTTDSDVLLQRFAPEIADGERSLVFVDGAYSHATKSVPADGEFRSHHDYGGENRPFEPSPALVEQAGDALRTATDLRGVENLPYARVDGIERDGTLRLMELELVEPYLGLQRAGGGALDRLADAVAAHVRQECNRV